MAFLIYFAKEFMKMKTSVWLEKLIETIVRLSGTFSAIVVLLIILFLFKEGSGLFEREPITEGFSLVVNSYNTVDELTPRQIRSIIEKDINNWKQLDNTFNEDIFVFTLSTIDKFFTEKDLGPNFEFLTDKVMELVQSKIGIFAVLPSANVDPTKVKVIKVKKITLASMFTGKDWYPTSEPSPQLGILAVILGTIWVSLGAMAIALPIGLSVAIFLAEVSTPNLRSVLKFVIEILAGIPSIVYGFFGLVILVPLVQKTFDLPVGETALTGAIILSIIALPTIISLSEDAIRSTPRELKESSLALGATHWQSIYKVVLPYSASGIASACILGVGRAMGETMAVLMVTGNSAIMPETFLKPVRTITASIAAELGEAPQGGIHYQALFVMGSVLFVFTFFVNLTAELVKPKKL
jgi:phosphate transport system permease protein